MATTLKLVEWLAAGVTTTAGVAVASGKVRFYQPATMTPQTVYSDDAGASAITQPLTLSAGGNSIVYTLDPVRMILKDSLDVSTLYDVTLNVLRDDQMYVTSAAFNGGVETTQEAINDAVVTSFGGSAGFWKYKESSSATERNIKDWLGDLYVSIKDFGAVGDDSTDNQTAIDNAIARVNAAGKGTVFVPYGTFRHSGTIYLTPGVSLKGLGRERSILKSTGALTSGITVPSGTSVSVFVEDVSITKVSADTGSRGFQTPSASCRAHLNRVLFSGFWYGVDASSTGGVFVNDVTVTTDGAADAIGIITSTSTVITASTITATTGTGIDVSDGFAVITGGNAISAANGILGNGTLTGLTIVGNKITATTNAVWSLPPSGAEPVSLTVVGNKLDAPTGIRIAVDSIRFHQSGNDFLNGYIVDSRVASPVAFVLSGTTSVTPLPAKSDITKIVQGGAAAVTTINAPTGTFEFGKTHTVVCSNTSGGALTWTWNAAFKISAAVAPATGNRITVVFYRDPVDSTWSEVTRSAAVPN